jgi:hypothetical protein
LLLVITFQYLQVRALLSDAEASKSHLQQSLDDSTKQANHITSITRQSEAARKEREDFWQGYVAKQVAEALVAAEASKKETEVHWQGEVQRVEGLVESANRRIQRLESERDHLTSALKEMNAVQKKNQELEDKIRRQEAYMKSRLLRDRSNLQTQLLASQPLVNSGAGPAKSLDGLLQGFAVPIKPSVLSSNAPAAHAHSRNNTVGQVENNLQKPVSETTCEAALCALQSPSASSSLGSRKSTSPTYAASPEMPQTVQSYSYRPPSAKAIAAAAAVVGSAGSSSIAAPASSSAAALAAANAAIVAVSKITAASGPAKLWASSQYLPSDTTNVASASLVARPSSQTASSSNDRDKAPRYSLFEEELNRAAAAASAEVNQYLRERQAQVKSVR